MAQHLPPSGVLSSCPGTHSRILSRIQRAAQTVLGVYLNIPVCMILVHLAHQGFLTIMRYTNPRIHLLNKQQWCHSQPRSWRWIQTIRSASESKSRFTVNLDSVKLNTAWMSMRNGVCKPHLTTAAQTTRLNVQSSWRLLRTRTPQSQSAWNNQVPPRLHIHLHHREK